MILVVGTGRSGTSDCARELEELGVNMGHRFHIGDEFNPKGYFEDRDFQELNMMYTMMELHRGIDEHTKDRYDIWKEKFDELVNSRKGLWGLKDPGIADFPPLLQEYLNLNPKIVLCSRDKADTINSLKRFKNLTQEQAEDIYNTRLKNLKTALQGKEYLDIDCYAKNKKELLTKWILG